MFQLDLVRQGQELDNFNDQDGSCSSEHNSKISKANKIEGSIVMRPTCHVFISNRASSESQMLKTGRLEDNSLYVQN